MGERESICVNRNRYRCDRQKIINLCFADDLFIFARGTVESATVVWDALEEFKHSSGLVPSIPKSKAYFCNVPNAIKHVILMTMLFEEGSLPVTYLGVPLVSSRLLYRNCKVLIAQLQSREMKRGRAKVAWETVCKPKSTRGLGIKRLEEFNASLMTTHYAHMEYLD
nr:hypothetical protein [Tanacetum cinerariifolium]